MNFVSGFASRMNAGVHTLMLGRPRRDTGRQGLWKTGYEDERTVDKDGEARYLE